MRLQPPQTTGSERQQPFDPSAAPPLHPGAVIWFTGLPASGKSSIAREVYAQLLDRGCSTELLDGAEVRESLSRGLGFSRVDREENVRRIGYVAKLLSRNGVIAICAAVSPYRESRDEVRRNTTNFVEVFVDCPVAVAEARDTEGRYAAARRGELKEFTGVSDPYEAPERPDIHVDAGTLPLDRSVTLVMTELERLGIAPRITRREDALRDRIYRQLKGLEGA